MDEFDNDDDMLEFSDLEENSGSDDDELDGGNGIPLTLGEDSSVSPSSKKPKGMRHLKEMKSVLGLDAMKEKAERKRERKKRAKERKKLRNSVSASVVQTMASKLKGSISAPEIVTFSGSRRKRKDGGNTNEKNNKSKQRKTESSSSSEVTMKNARFDVFKFGVSGFAKENKADAELRHLLSLGAKPKKGKCLDYREFKEIRKKEKEEEKSRKEMQRISGIKIGRKGNSTNSKAKSSNKRNKKSASGSSSGGGMMGKFDGGMLKLSAKDLAKIRGK